MKFSRQEAAAVERQVVAIETAGGEILDVNIAEQDVGGLASRMSKLLSGEGNTRTTLGVVVALTDDAPADTETAVADALDERRIDDPVFEGEPIGPDDAPLCGYCRIPMENTSESGLAVRYQCPDCESVLQPGPKSARAGGDGQ